MDKVSKNEIRPESTRYGVVRYPTYYVVIDKADDNKIVYETRSWGAAHYRAKKLNQGEAS